MRHRKRLEYGPSHVTALAVAGANTAPNRTIVRAIPADEREEVFFLHTENYSIGLNSTVGVKDNGGRYPTVGVNFLKPSEARCPRTGPWFLACASKTYRRRLRRRLLPVFRSPTRQCNWQSSSWISHPSMHGRTGDEVRDVHTTLRGKVARTTYCATAPTLHC